MNDWFGSGWACDRLKVKMTGYELSEEGLKLFGARNQSNFKLFGKTLCLSKEGIIW